MSSTIQLPDKPSELIRLALSDLRKCEQDKNYIIDMGSWHKPNARGVCQICLAGAVISKTMEVPHTKDFCWFGVDPSLSSKLQALDCFRAGDISDAVEELGFDRPHGIPDWKPIVDYSDNPAQFHLDMESLAALLERNGL